MLRIHFWTSYIMVLILYNVPKIMYSLNSKLPDSTILYVNESPIGTMYVILWFKNTHYNVLRICK